jgi:hypothetical protein
MSWPLISSGPRQTRTAIAIRTALAAATGRHILIIVAFSHRLHTPFWRPLVSAVPLGSRRYRCAFDRGYDECPPERRRHSTWQRTAIVFWPKRRRLQILGNEAALALLKSALEGALRFPLQETSKDRLTIATIFTPPFAPLCGWDALVLRLPMGLHPENRTTGVLELS